MHALEIFRRNTVALLAQLNWKYAELGKRTGIAASAISVYLSGKKDPNVETCEKIALAFGLSLADMIRDDGVPEPKEKMIPLSEHIKKVNELTQGLEGLRDTLNRENDLIIEQTRELNQLREKSHTSAWRAQEGKVTFPPGMVENLACLSPEIRTLLLQSWMAQLKSLLSRAGPTK